MKKIISLITLYLLCSGCARMVVGVQTADLEMVQKKYKTLKKEQTLIESSIANVEIEKQLKNSKAEFEALTNELTDIIENREKINDLINSIRAKYTRAFKENKASNYDNLTQYYKYIIEKSKSVKLLISEAKEHNNATKNAKIVEQTNKVKKQIEKLENQIKKIENTKTSYKTPTRRNLLSDLLTSYVTSDKAKKNKIWKSEYNKAKSTTGFGNADIAVVLMEDPQSYNNNYSIKGVRVDADKLIQSSFDVLAQSITLLASTTGVVPQGSGDKDNYFAPSEIPQIKQLIVKKTELRKKQEQLKAYKNLIILEILNRDFDNLQTDDEVKNAIKEVTTIWAAYKSQLTTKE